MATPSGMHWYPPGCRSRLHVYALEYVIMITTMNTQFSLKSLLTLSKVSTEYFFHKYVFYILSNQNYKKINYTIFVSLFFVVLH